MLTCRQSPMIARLSTLVTLFVFDEIKKATNINVCCFMGLGRLGLPTSRLSGVRSNRLSYKPVKPEKKKHDRSAYDHAIYQIYPLKEVIQPQVPLRLPCYDFTPAAVRSVGGCLLYRLAHRLRVQTTPMV